MAKKKAKKKAGGPSSTTIAPVQNDCPTKLNVRDKMRDVLLEGGHTSKETAMKQLDLLLAVIARYSPPLLVFCEGVVAGHMEGVLDDNGPFQLTGRGRVYYDQPHET